MYTLLKRINGYFIKMTIKNEAVTIHQQKYFYIATARF